jgi:hypothetical protein
MGTYLWDRQPGESAPAYEAARLYFDMGAQRNIDAVVQKLDKSRTLIGRWSGRWAWVDRAAAWDAMLRSRELAQREAAQAAEAERWAARRAAEAEREWAFAEQLMERARAMLAFPLQTRELAEDGKTIIVKPARWAIRDAAGMADTAAKLARLAAGMETDRATLQGPGGEPLFAPSDVAQALKAIAESQARHADR